ncbi:heme ABC transporter permease [Rickettsia prowazekii]|uniref:Heme exporter protein C n=2 Tax=Rickettsia prowazekii TaxID=782 RepID=Q9ZCC7_RICPR|nr:heme ABC transporter permease [Rickettsia prowazekii]EOB10239.1 Heme exporter protein C [Rickettsia prowazekii str. GvF12]ADE30404.1 Heme exporter protein C [Rickettsia prowazekii str. Rp22]AFE49625.1 HEME exporter protein C (ccmC) [Rickettsia prowazekii str. Chernikova]AFE50469.1 HEME exporter protein C (ccmC) [Rickettsia prowazekii str. Katsinyian]AFE51312.1 HEME exporter protein C (ccmC) [Rickettsia prowazekii str. BuV67-CWPP]
MLKLLTPYYFNKLSRIIIPILAVSTLVMMIIALYLALIVSPIDYQQGEFVRIMYVHVPASWMALGIYVFMAICSFSYLVWKTTISYLLAVASSDIGAIFTLISLVTGSLWGKPIWGTWWVWDARLTSMLILFLLYLSYIIIVNSVDNIRKAQNPASIIALIGLINIPIIKFSVNIWYSLHQPASVLRLGSPTIHASMLKPLITMFISFILYFLLVLLLRTVILIDKIKNR